MLDFLEDGLEDLGQAIAVAEAEVAKGQRPATAENIRPGTAVERTDGSVVMNKGGKVMVKPTGVQKQQMALQKGMAKQQMLAMKAWQEEQMRIMQGKGPTMPVLADGVADAPDGDDILDFLDETNVAAIPAEALPTQELMKSSAVVDERAKTPARPTNPVEGADRGGERKPDDGGGEEAGFVVDENMDMVITTTASGAPLPYRPATPQLEPMRAATAAMGLRPMTGPGGQGGKGSKRGLVRQNSKGSTGNKSSSGKGSGAGSRRRRLSRGRGKSVDKAFDPMADKGVLGKGVGYMTKGGIHKGPIQLQEENLLNFQDEVDMQAIVQEVQAEQEQTSQQQWSSDQTWTQETTNAVPWSGAQETNTSAAWDNQQHPATDDQQTVPFPENATSRPGTAAQRPGTAAQRPGTAAQQTTPTGSRDMGRPTTSQTGRPSTSQTGRSRTPQRKNSATPQQRSNTPSRSEETGRRASTKPRLDMGALAKPKKAKAKAGVTKPPPDSGTEPGAVEE